jgi:hypothetical protein
MVLQVCGVGCKADEFGSVERHIVAKSEESNLLKKATDENVEDDEDELIMLLTSSTTTTIRLYRIRSADRQVQILKRHENCN